MHDRSEINIPHVRLFRFLTADREYGCAEGVYVPAGLFIDLEYQS